jgi:hypothetical protein
MLTLVCAQLESSGWRVEDALNLFFAGGVQDSFEDGGVHIPEDEDTGFRRMMQEREGQTPGVYTLAVIDEMHINTESES